MTNCRIPLRSLLSFMLWSRLLLSHVHFHVHLLQCKKSMTLGREVWELTLRSEKWKDISTVIPSVHWMNLKLAMTVWSFLIALSSAFLCVMWDRISFILNDCKPQTSNFQHKASRFIEIHWFLFYFSGSFVQWAQCWFSDDIVCLWSGWEFAIDTLPCKVWNSFDTANVNANFMPGAHCVEIFPPSQNMKCNFWGNKFQRQFSFGNTCSWCRQSSVFKFRNEQTFNLCSRPLYSCREILPELHEWEGKNLRDIPPFTNALNTQNYGPFLCLHSDVTVKVILTDPSTLMLWTLWTVSVTPKFWKGTIDSVRWMSLGPTIECFRLHWC